MKILIIEDNDIDFEITKKILDQEQVNISWVKTGGDALALLKSEAFDCLILDFMLPDYDGLNLIRELRDRNIYCPIVVLTGCGSEILATKTIQNGAQNYFPKDKLGDEKELFADCVLKTANLVHLKLEATTSLVKQRVKELSRHMDSYCAKLN